MEEIRMNIKNNKNCKVTINDEVISVSEKEKTADELFKELGYIKYDNHPEQDFPTEPNMFTTQDVRRLYYEQTGVLESGMKGLEHIEFDLIKRNVVCWATINDRFVLVPLSMQELQAIDKKVRELRLDIMKINNLKESIEYFKKINDYGNGGN